MRCTHALVAALAVVLCAAGAAKADVFGTGANQFNMDFVPISGATNPVNWIGVVNHDYRMGTYEVTNDQWDKFAASLGVPVTGSPATGYDASTAFPGANISVTNVSWLEAAQFVNWLNTSTGHHAAYNFTGTQGTADFTWAQWSDAEAAPGTSWERHKDAIYYLPTDDEWFKAAYWNGTTIQTYATKDGALPTAGVDANYGYTYPAGQPWGVGSGSQELNGTYDMMGNVCEWSESYEGAWDYRSLFGGAFDSGPTEFIGKGYYGGAYCDPDEEHTVDGFRVASAAIPEPASLLLLTLGGLGLLRRRRR